MQPQATLPEANSGLGTFPPSGTNTPHWKNLLPSMQICVYPSARLIFVLLRGFVSSRPVAFSIPPQSSKRIAQPSGRSISKQGFAELLQVHEARLPSANLRRQPDIRGAYSNPSRDEKFLLILFLDYGFLK